MDFQLQERWQSGSPPFDGDCLHFDDHIQLSLLRTLLIEMVNQLCPLNSDEPLYRIDDWHEHDGFITERTVVDWNSLNEILVSDESLYASRHGDSYVNWAYYSENYSFLIRFDVLDADDDPQYPGIWGDCDLSAPASVIQTVKDAVPQSIGSKLLVMSANEYFGRIYAG